MTTAAPTAAHGAAMRPSSAPPSCCKARAAGAPPRTARNSAGGTVTWTTYTPRKQWRRCSCSRKRNYPEVGRTFSFNSGGLLRAQALVILGHGSHNAVVNHEQHQPGVGIFAVAHNQQAVPIHIGGRRTHPANSVQRG